MPGKGRATGYTDYWKNRNSTPGGGYDDDEEDTVMPSKRFTPKAKRIESTMSPEDKKAAIKRRLAMKRAGK